MAIQPRYAHAILAGTKRIEFRKRRLASDVHTVLIYESAPTQRIVGQFSLARTILATPQSLWRGFGSVGSIGRAEYLNYYGDRDQAIGLVIDRVERFTHPVALADLSLRPSVPQSFMYLPPSAFAEVRALSSNGAASPTAETSRRSMAS